MAGQGTLNPLIEVRILVPEFNAFQPVGRRVRHYYGDHSSIRLEHLVVAQEVVGSSPTGHPFLYELPVAIAQPGAGLSVYTSVS